MPTRLSVLLSILIMLPLALAQSFAGERSMQGSRSIAGERSAQDRIIDKWRGTWEVKAVRRAPKPAQEITYEETFEWVLDGRFLRSETARKSDGSRSMVMFWFDAATKTYRWVYFDTAGYAVELPPPSWNEAKQTMEWESGTFSPTSYSARATFKDADTIEWRSLWKDWKGTPILELEGVSRRRK
jgi:hypothetical protein